MFNKADVQKIHINREPLINLSSLKELNVMNNSCKYLDKPGVDLPQQIESPGYQMDGEKLFEPSQSIRVLGVIRFVYRQLN